jgi:signal peptidase II
MNRILTSPRAVSWIVVVAIFLVDFVTKRVVLANQAQFLSGIDLIDGILRFTYVRNAGAAFGMMQGARWILTAVSIVAVIGLSWVISRRQTTGLKRIASTMILAGAAGNLVDRLFYQGLVVDFIEMGYAGRTFPVYNVADMGVSLGAVVLVLSLLVEREHSEPEPAEPAPAEVGYEGDADGARD